MYLTLCYYTSDHLFIEKEYRSGNVYENGFEGEGYEIWCNDVAISDYEISGFSGNNDVLIVNG